MVEFISIVIGSIFPQILLLAAAIFLYICIKEKKIAIPISLFLIITALFLSASSTAMNQYIRSGVEELEEHEEYFYFQEGSFSFIHANHPEISGATDFDIQVVCMDDNGKQCTGLTDCIIDVFYPNETEVAVGNMTGPDANGKFNYTMLNTSLATIGYYEYWITCEGGTKGGGLNAFFRVEGLADWEEQLESEITNQYRTVVRAAWVITAFFIIMVLWQFLNLAVSNIQNGKRR